MIATSHPSPATRHHLPATLDPKRIRPLPGQPRKRFRAIPALAAAIKRVGQVTPILVSPVVGVAGIDAQLVDGERRLRACLLLDRPIRVNWEDPEHAESAFARSVAANFCRQEHDPIEISEAVWKLKDAGHTVEEIAEIFGKGVAWVGQYTALVKLAPQVRARLETPGDEARQSKAHRRRKGRMTMQVAMLLTPLDHRDQVRAAETIERKKMGVAAARNYIRGLAAKAGKKVGQTASPAKRWAMLRNATETFRNILVRYSGMKHKEFAPIVEAAGPAEARALSKELDALCEDALMLADFFAGRAGK